MRNIICHFVDANVKYGFAKTNMEGSFCRRQMPLRGTK